MGSARDMDPSEDKERQWLLGFLCHGNKRPGLRSSLVAVGLCAHAWSLTHKSPSNISTIRKKAREKEDFPLPVRPQIPIWKRSRCIAAALGVHRCQGHSAAALGVLRHGGHILGSHLGFLTSSSLVRLDSGLSLFPMVGSEGALSGSQGKIIVQMVCCAGFGMGLWGDPDPVWERWVRKGEAGQCGVVNVAWGIPDPTASWFLGPTGNLHIELIHRLR